MAQLGVIFVQYDQSRYAQAFPLLLEVLSPLSHWTVFTIKVDNRNESQPLKQLAPNQFEIGGDNGVYEFSGWMKGWHALQAQQIVCDGYLFVTDAFMAYGNPYHNVLDDDLLDFLLQESAVGGMMDPPPKKWNQLHLGSWQITHWVRSSFFFLTSSILEQMQTLITFPNVSAFCDNNYQGRAFLPEAPLSLHYRLYLEDWITQKWHRAFALSEDTWEAFCLKIRSILNEHALTGRWQEMKIPIYDLYFLSHFRDKHHQSFQNLKTSRLDTFRYDVKKQKDYCIPPIWLRAYRKLSRLFLLP